MIDDESGNVGEASHVKNLERRPFDAVRFAADDQVSGEALRGEDVIHQQAYARRGAENCGIIAAGRVTQFVAK